MVAHYSQSGRQPTDEMLLEALQRIDPPLLFEDEMIAVSGILGRKRGRRPKQEFSIEMLAYRIAHSNRYDVPEHFLAALSQRLRKAKGLTGLFLAIRAQKKIDKLQRGHLICAIYSQLWKMQDGKNFVIHPDFGRLEGPETGCTRSERALFMTQTVMHKILEDDPPSTVTMLNIITRNN